MSTAAIDWHRCNRSDVLFNDEEVWALSRIDADDPALLRSSISIAEKEMLCQRDMRVRGRRLWSYHARVGDLADYFVFPRFGPPGIGYMFSPATDAYEAVEHGVVVLPPVMAQ